MPNVFDWLDEVRARPGMYLRGGSLLDLESKVYGYYAGLASHGIVEPVPAMDHHFASWLYHRTRWSMSCGWGAGIADRHKRPERAVAAFFRLVDGYRRLRPTVVCTVRLRARHNPTGKRVVVGLDGRLAKPRRVDVVRYRPAPLHFLRLHYPTGVQDQPLLMTGSGSFVTTVRYAKRWVQDELQVEPSAWERPAGPV